MEEGEGARDDEELHVDGEDGAQMEEPADSDPGGDRAAATLASALASMDEAEGCGTLVPR